MNARQKKVLYRIMATIVIVAIYKLTGVREDSTIGALLYLIPYLLIGYDILLKALKGIRKHQVFDENFLMAVATVGAYGLRDYLEATAVMLFYQIGELFQSYAVGKSRRSISALMDIRPDYANIEVDGQLQQVDPYEVEVGQTIVIQPGERVPLDGIVIRGSSSLNTAALTGESKPRDVGEGDEVISGCINNEGVLHVQTTRDFEGSTVSRILDLVENASSLKSKSENFISRFAHYYTPAVCFSALALALLPPLFNYLTGKPADFSVWLYRALSFLVISCPCALVISIPLSFFAGLGGASRQGILIKGSNYLETLSQVRCVVFDKTGTITKGVFEVTGVHKCPIDREEMLQYAALAECRSLHPIARSIRAACQNQLDESRVEDVREYSGHGVVAVVDGRQVAVGNHKLMDQLNIEYQNCEDDVGTVIHVAVDGVYCGHLLIADVIKENARQAIRQLHDIGVSSTIMLTGDDERVARSVADEVQIREYRASLLPQQKVEEVEKILASSSGKVAFVGDGINDAPVLTRCDLGIAMGAMGSDAAIEAADVVLMDDDLLKIAKSVKISRKCLRIVYENIIFAIGVKLVCLLLGALGITNMWAAIFADVGVMVIAVLNAIRALFVGRI
ncbi:MAG: cadmium-translocating P-type ATPase [Erysipelotrichaceae bacterium]|nr:cadmium-translocating P-type ATPase [Erysipelotrichaceae bacterium]